jgi:hypothetical protein
MSHFWGSYPTVFLSEYALGVRPTKPGYSTFLFGPLPGFKTEWVHGRVPTPAGLIYAAWGYNKQGKIVMEITAPSGLQGTLVPPFKGSYSVGSQKGQSGHYTIAGGATVIIVQE